MKFIKHIFLSACCLMMVNITSAQFSIYGSAGLSGLKYKVEGSIQNTEIGYGAGIGYSFKIVSTVRSAWKAGLALELATYGNKALFSSLSEKYTQGTDKNKFLFAYSLSDYEEKQFVTMLSIPVTLQYQVGGIIRFCLSGGIKFGLPISAQATINPGTLEASGEYEYEGQTYTNLPQHGFPNGMKLPEAKHNIDLGFSTAATVETGLLVRKFYIGLYLDYGFNNMQKNTDKHLLEYKETNTSMFAHNSILNTNMVNKINLFCAGLKMKIQL
jgi:hypothetical protein